MSEIKPTGTRTLAIIRAHEVAIRTQLRASQCYAILVCSAEGYVTALRIEEGVGLTINTAGSVLRNLELSKFMYAEKVKKGKTAEYHYRLTEEGKNLAKKLLS